MGIFNEHSSDSYTSDYIKPSIGSVGARGPVGRGYTLTADVNYDIQNKKLVNVKSPTANTDASTKQYVDSKTSLLDNARGGYVVNDKAVIYSNTGGIHTQSLYLKDNPDDAGNSDELRILTEHQSYNNIHLYIPDLRNYYSFGGRRKSEMMVTSVVQTVTGIKLFRDIEVSIPTEGDDATNKNYVDNNCLNKNTGGLIMGSISTCYSFSCTKCRFHRKRMISSDFSNRHQTITSFK